MINTVHGILQARILKWVAIPFSSGPCFVRTLHHDPSVLGGPAQYSFIELDKAVIHVISLVFCDCGFHSGSHIWMWELDHKQGWVSKNWCFWTVVLEKTLESPLDCKHSKAVSPKGNQLWIFTGRTNAESPILWPPDQNTNSLEKDSDAGRDWRQEKKGTTGDEMVGWHHRIDGREFEWIPGVGEKQGSLVCCGPWGHNKSDVTEWLNNKNSGSRSSEWWLVCQLGTSWF